MDFFRHSLMIRTAISPEDPFVLVHGVNIGTDIEALDQRRATSNLAHSGTWNSQRVFVPRLRLPRSVLPVFRREVVPVHVPALQLPHQDPDPTSIINGRPARARKSNNQEGRDRRGPLQLELRLVLETFVRQK